MYSRHTLLMCGAHKSDICPLNKSDEGCDSLLHINQGAISRKEDLELFKYRCTLRNGGSALLKNLKQKVPVRIFRQVKTMDGKCGFRYDGLYSPIAMMDENGKPRTEPNATSKGITFMFKRNPAGPRAKFSNRMMLEDLFRIVQEAHVGRKDLQIPSLAHSGPKPHNNFAHGQPNYPPMPMAPDLQNHYHAAPSMPPGVSTAFSSAPIGHNASHFRPAMGQHRTSSRAHLERQTSAEVSVLHIRYFDEPNRGKGGGQQSEPQIHPGLHHSIPTGIHPSMHPNMHAGMHHNLHPAMHTPMHSPMPPHHGGMYAHPGKPL
uniref:YDG domain-containing protein n=1 Tax=Cyclophora tenuis TaxID=216820 RepID=A0A7S1DDD9_CYCTE